MKMTRKVRSILDNYDSDSPGVKASLARILMQGRLGGTGKLVILPVDQGFEHFISIFVLKRKRSRAASKPGHSLTERHSESSTISTE